MEKSTYLRKESGYLHGAVMTAIRNCTPLVTSNSKNLPNG